MDPTTQPLAYRDPTTGNIVPRVDMIDLGPVSTSS